VLKENGTFMHYLIRAFLLRTEAKQYVKRLFGPIFNRLYNFTALPPDIKKKLLRNLLNQDIDFSQTQVINPLIKGTKEVIEPMKAYEVMAFCEVLLNNIVESIPFFPQSIRYLLKAIQQYIIEEVITLINIRILNLVMRLLLILSLIFGGYPYSLSLEY